MKQNFTNLALAVLRIGASLLMLTHGIPKIERLFASPVEFPDPLGVGATLSLILALIGEVVGPLLVIIGYKTKLASIPPIVTMLVAIFFVHLSDPFKVKEKAILFLLLFVVIFLAGPGKYSVDRR